MTDDSYREDPDDRVDTGEQFHDGIVRDESGFAVLVGPT